MLPYTYGSEYHRCALSSRAVVECAQGWVIDVVLDQMQSKTAATNTTVRKCAPNVPLVQYVAQLSPRRTVLNNTTLGRSAIHHGT